MIELLRRAYGTYLHYFRKAFLYPKQSIEWHPEANYDEYWRKRRQGGMGILSSWQKSRADLALARIEAKELSLTIADVGAGDGQVLKYLRSKLPKAEVVAYDSSPLALESARESGVRAVHLDLSAENWRELIETCDYGILFEIIEHVPNSEELVETLLEKARRGVFISIPNSGFLTYRFRLLMGMFPMQWVRYPNEHLRYWTLRDMRWWLRALGLADRAEIVGYKGVPFLNRIYPALFAEGLFISIKK